MHTQTEFSLATLLRQRFFWIITTILALVSAILAYVPLTGVLGLEYSLFFGAPATLLCGHLALRGVWLRGAYGLQAPALWPTTLRLLAAGYLALLPSLLLICLNALRVPNCNWPEGFAYFGLLPIVGVLWGTAFGMACALISRKRLAVTALYVIPLLSIIWVLWGAFAHPPIFAYNLFFGFYPGSLYDELRPISQTLILYRLWTLAAAIGLLGLIALWAGRQGFLGNTHYAWREAAWSPTPHALDGRLRHTGHMETTLSATLWTLVALASVSVGFFHRHDLGFVHTNASIQRALGGRFETPHFVLYYDIERTQPRQIERLARDHEFRYHQLVRYFGHKPKQKIESYLFVSAAQKNQYMGAERTMIARPWAYQMYLHGIGFPHNVLKHELAHVFSAQFGHGPFRIAAQYGLLPLNALIEGVAVAADWERDDLTPHQWCKAMMEKGQKIDPAKILGPAGFFQQSSAIAYRVAGSFSRYLIDQYGIERYKLAYGKADFTGVYQRPLEQLAHEWREFLKHKVQLSTADRHYARYAFRTFRSIFHRTCPHEIAALRTQIATASQTQRYRTALALQQRLCSIDNHPYNQLSTIDLLFASKQYTLAAEQLETMRRNFPPILYPVFHSRILQRLAQIRFQQRDLQQAQDLLQAIPLEKLPFHYQREIAIRRSALQQASTAHILFDYLDQDRKIAPLLALQRATLQFPQIPDFHYLLGRRLYFDREYALAESILQKATFSLQQQPALYTETLRMTATSAFLRGDYTTAHQRFTHLANLKIPMPSGLRASAVDWAERAQWEAQIYRTPPTHDKP